MSHARAHHRRAERAARRAATGLPTTPGTMLPEGHYGVLPAWCFHRSDLPDARRMTHDALIESMGATRSGGVSWIDAHGDEAHRLLAELDKGASEAMAPYLAEVRHRLETEGGYVVVAMAPGTPPAELGDGEAQP